MELRTINTGVRTTKMLVIDAQNDVCDDDSAYARSITESGEKRDVRPLQKAVAKIIPFLDKLRKNKIPIGFIQSIYSKGQYSYSGISEKWLTIDSYMQDPYWRIKIYRDMPKQDESIFKKDSQETFTYKGKDNGLDDWLKGTNKVLIAGFTTDGCVNKGVCALIQKGYRPLVLEDCVATSGYKMNTAHRYILEKYKLHEAIRVVSLTDLKI